MAAEEGVGGLLGLDLHGNEGEGERRRRSGDHGNERAGCPFGVSMVSGATLSTASCDLRLEGTAKRRSDVLKLQLPSPLGQQRLLWVGGSCSPRASNYA